MRLRDGHAAEEVEGGDDERVEDRRDLGAGRQRRDGLRQRHREDLADEHHQELIPGTVRRALEAGHVVQREEERDAADDAVWQLGQQEGEGKDEVRIHPRRRFAVVDEPCGFVLELDLRQQERGDRDDLEDDENSVLQRGWRVVEMQIGQAGDERHEDVVEQSREAVVGRAPEGDVGALRDSLELMPERDRGILFVKKGSRWGETALGLELRDVVLDVAELRRIRKYVRPVLVADSGRLSCSDDI